MRGTPVFGFPLWPKIHQPLPRTPRQSQQLLDALTSSFRRQLDQEHPSPSPPSEHHGNGNPPAENPHSSVHATTKHLQNILDNPLFRVVPSKSLDGRVLDKQRLATEPMLLFDDMAASGSVTSEILQCCLGSQLILASKQPGKDFTEAMKESRAGSRVVNWWFASDSHERMMLFKSIKTTRMVIKLMVAEGLQKTILVWLDLVEKQDIGGQNGRIPKHIVPSLYAGILNNLVSAELKHGAGFPSALQHYLQASKRLLANDKIPLWFRRQALQPAAAFLNGTMRAEPQEAPVVAFEEFVNDVATMWPSSSMAVSLPLLHPTEPNPNPFLDYVKKVSPGRFESWDEQEQAKFMKNGFDALRVLMDQDRSQDASDLAQFMQQSLPALRGKTTTRETFKSAQEHFLARVNLSLT
ncbi:hypothetical protein P170DRAFT_507573 [Aspergillus steynii IBT 23096]|uniref:Uncharacterized protein n=1 Tax=Aspergillus steynii IBT 23096 TaxID=1392250 RepID=A0A2I2GIX1_9EURO|nr:uncharacterized protein P170DRAFT_507573 [Aspergillus steynii IBT 23096]PLB52834.1 hypothetical protein P170DRAFT_507573 [Aspergillus steynii IBT 23096]